MSAQACLLVYVRQHVNADPDIGLALTSHPTHSVAQEDSTVSKALHENVLKAIASIKAKNKSVNQNSRQVRRQARSTANPGRA